MNNFELANIPSSCPSTISLQNAYWTSQPCLLPMRAMVKLITSSQGEKLLWMLFATSHPSIHSDPHAGLIDIFSVSPVPIAIGRDRAANLNSHHIFPFLQNHPLQLPDGSPMVVPMEQFLCNWDIFTNGILKDLD